MNRRRKHQHAFKGGTEQCLSCSRERHVGEGVGDVGKGWNGMEEVEAGPSRITIDDLEDMERARDRERGTRCAECGVGIRDEIQRIRRRGVVAGAEDGDYTWTSQRQRSPDRLFPFEGTPSAPRSQSRLPSPILASILALSLCSTALAAPPIVRRQSPSPDLASSSSSPQSTYNPTRTITLDPASPSFTALSKLAHEEDSGPIQYLTSLSRPSHLPHDIYLVPETTLPYYLSRQSDGTWSKVDNAWLLYGRQAAASTVDIGTAPDPSATANPLSSGVAAFDPNDFAVNENLPRGWGVSASRSDFYKVPLISVASVVLAVVIVAAIIFIVISRRKAHRKAKRRAAKLRRKALAAAGLNENDLDNSAAAAALKEKLMELDQSRVGKGRRRQRGPTALVRTKVRSWNQGLRRRRGKGTGDGDISRNGDEDAVIEVIEPKPVDVNGDAENRGRDSSDTTRSTPTIPTSRSSGEPGSLGTEGTDSALRTSSDDPSTSPDTSVGVSVSDPAPAAGVTPYFPPAYRPASVRSLAIYSHHPVSHPPHHSSGDLSSDLPSGSSPSGAGAVASVRSPTEKTRAPGYYPAPATEESEAALAVAARSDGDGKAEARMAMAAAEGSGSVDEEAEAARIRHIATDDKRVLERLRMGASAPSRSAAADLTDGPSAPDVEVDDQGFERVDSGDLGTPLAVSGSSGIDTALASAESQSSDRALGNIPAPPKPPVLRTLPVDGPVIHAGSALPSSVGDGFDIAHLLPSAPPGADLGSPRHPASGRGGLHPELNEDVRPSAPPDLGEDDSRVSDEGDVDSGVPSAPPMVPEMEEDDEVVEGGITSTSPLQLHPYPGIEASLNPSINSAINGASGSQAGGIGEGSSPIDQSRDVDLSPEASSSEVEITGIESATAARRESEIAARGGVVFLPKYEP